MEITKSIFREYDIRGIYPDEINEAVVDQIAKAISINVTKKMYLKYVLGEMVDFLAKAYFLFYQSHYLLMVSKFKILAW
jgi:hypothetical protein